MFRGLKPDEIELRVGTIANGKVNLLLYKDARCDMNVLDETYGAEGWQRDHKEIKGNLYAGVGIYSEKHNEWIWKWDCGTESNTEKEKGEASDSFKRACFNLGIGRELYTGGMISIKCETIKNERGKYDLANKWQFFGARVSDVQYEETETKRSIIGITVVDSNGNILFERRGEVDKLKKKTIGKANADALKMKVETLSRDLEKLLEYYHVKKVEELTLEQWQHAMTHLDK